MALEVIDRLTHDPALEKEFLGVIGTVDTGYAPDEYVDTLAGLYVPGPKRLKLVTGCSDDRGPTEESIEDINGRFENTLGIDEGYVRFWAGKWGMAAVALSASAAEKHADGIEQNYGYYQTAEAIVRATDKRAMGHSAAKTEGSNLSCMHGNAPMGCLACAVLGTAMHLLLTDDHIKAAAYEDQQKYFGSTERFDQVMTGYEHLAHEFAQLSPTRKTEDFSVTRRDFQRDISLGRGVMILDGDHAPAKETAVVFGCQPEMISNPLKANRLGKPFYAVDGVGSAEQIGRLVQEREMFTDWELYLRSALGLTTVARAALSAHDNDASIKGKLEPRNLAIGFTGDPQEAIQYLNGKYGN